MERLIIWKLGKFGVWKLGTRDVGSCIIKKFERLELLSGWELRILEGWELKRWTWDGV